MDSSSRALSCRLSPEYLKTIPGLLKIAQMVLSIIAFATACAVSDKLSSYSEGDGFGWVSFVAITGFIMAVLCLVLHLLLSTNWSWPRFVELILYGVWTICFMIAGIVAAALAAKIRRKWYWSSRTTPNNAAAAAAFSFFCMVVWAVDTVFQAMNVRGSVTTTRTTTTTTATTNANTDVPQRYEGNNPQY